MTGDSYPVALLKARINTLKKQARAAAIKNLWLAADDYTRRANALQKQLDVMTAEQDKQAATGRQKDRIA